MPKTDIKKFHVAIREAAAWQGGRCGDTREADDPDIIAAAICASMMSHLRNYASHKLLAPADIEQAIEAFIDSSRMEEVEQRMGGTVFRRLGEPPETPKMKMARIRDTSRFIIYGGPAEEFVEVDSSHDWQQVQRLLMRVCMTGAQLRKATQIMLAKDPTERAKELEVEFKVEAK